MSFKGKKHDKGLYHILNVRNNAPNFQEVAGHFGSGLCVCPSITHFGTSATFLLIVNGPFYFFSEKGIRLQSSPIVLFCFDCGLTSR